MEPNAVNAFNKHIIKLVLEGNENKASDVLSKMPKILLENTDSNNRSLLMEAIESGRLLKEKGIKDGEMFPVSVLLGMESGFNHRDNETGKSALSSANEPFYFLPSLLIEKLSPKALETQDHDGNTDLMLALKEGNAEDALKIARKSEFLGQENNNGETLLSIAKKALKHLETADVRFPKLKANDLSLVIEEIGKKPGIRPESSNKLESKHLPSANASTPTVNKAKAKAPTR